MTMMNLIGRLV